MDEGIIQGGLYLSYVLLIVAGIAVIVGMVLGIMHDVKSGLFAIGGIVVMMLIFLIAYSVSSAELTPKLITDGFNASHMKMFAGGLVTFYVLFALAWAALIFDLGKSLIQGN